MKFKQIHMDLSDYLAWKSSDSEIEDLLARSDEIADLTYDEGHLLVMALAYPKDEEVAVILRMLLNYFEEKHHDPETGKETDDYDAEKEKLYDVIQKKVIPRCYISPESQAVLDEYEAKWFLGDTDRDEEFNPEDFAGLDVDNDESLERDEELLDHQESEDGTPPSSESSARISNAESDTGTPNEAEAGQQKANLLHFDSNYAPQSSLPMSSSDVSHIGVSQPLADGQ